MSDRLPDRSDHGPPRYYRWNDATNQWVETTKDDPRRIVYQSELPEMIAQKSMGLFGWLLAAAGVAIVGDIVLTHLKKK